MTAPATNNQAYKVVTFEDVLSHRLFKAGVMEASMGEPMRDLPKDKYEVCHYEAGRIFAAYLESEGVPVSPYTVNKRPRYDLILAARRAQYDDIWCGDRLRATCEEEKD